MRSSWAFGVTYRRERFGLFPPRFAGFTRWRGREVQFPLDVLPPFLRPLGFAMPITYWLELLRRSLVGEVAQAFPTLSSLSNLQLLAILVGLTTVFAIVAAFSFR